jgi:3-oxoacyl-[acyl-carrier protein] reductase
MQHGKLSIRRWVIDFDLKERWVLVGGASQGIGEATARFMAEQGARVILMSRRRDRLEIVRSELPNPTAHRTLALDLDNASELSLPVSRLMNETGPIGIWVNNTGGPKAGPLVDASPEELERAFRGHVMASQAILQALLPGMKQLGFGRIINVLSTSVKVPLPNLGVSNIMRAAMANWAKTLANELGPFGITVNNILPGYTDTPRLESILAGTMQKSGRSGEEIMKDWAEHTPLRRVAKPRETAQAIAFLASPLASYVTGINLPVDGGRTGSL